MEVSKAFLQFRRIVRRFTLVSSCYVSRGVAVRKVSISKSGLQGYSTALALVPFDGPHTISYYCSIATMSLSFTVNEISSLVSQNLKKSRDSENIPSGIIYYACTSTPAHKSAYEI